MQSKLLEVRDRATFVPVLAVQLIPSTLAENYLLARAGFGLDASTQSMYVQVSRIDGGTGQSTCDPHYWGDNRTMFTAHNYIIATFDELTTGDVIDVEYILGERDTPKVSESQT